MSRKLCTWAVLAIIGGGLLAGCGSSSSTTSSSQSTSTPAAASSTPTSTAGGTAPGAGVANVGAAVAACKRTIHSQSTLTVGAKSKLEAVCGKAAKGDTAAVHKAAQEVCEEVIRTSAVPAGSARERALAACKAG